MAEQNARLVQKVKDALDDLYDDIDYNFGKQLKPTEIYEYLSAGFGDDLADGYQDWYERGDEAWH